MMPPRTNHPLLKQKYLYANEVCAEAVHSNCDHQHCVINQSCDEKGIENHAKNCTSFSTRKPTAVQVFNKNVSS